jgi:hypothetical protein
MNTSSGSYLASLLLPARCDGAATSVSAFLKYWAERGTEKAGSLNRVGGVAKLNLTVRQAAAAGEMTSHICTDIGMTQGQYMAAQLAPVLDAESKGDHPQA